MNTKTQVHVTAFPKSGVTWLVRLLSDLLESPQQDTPEMTPVSWGPRSNGNYIVCKKHVYKRPESGIVVFSQRDPRDVAISAMYYRSLKDLSVSMRTMFNEEYERCIRAWIDKKSYDVATRYEDLKNLPVVELSNIYYTITEQGIARSRISEAVERQSIESHQKRTNDYHFHRKGIVGDWRNHFTRAIGEEFNRELGGLMLRLGYIDSLDWWKELPEEL